MNIIHKISNLDFKEFIRFLVVGVMATGINYIVYYSLQKAGFNINLSYAVGFIVSLSFNYLASNIFTFKTQPNIKRGLRFGVAHIINFLLQIILLNIVVFIGINEVYAPLPVYMISVPLNFLFVRFALKKNS